MDKSIEQLQKLKKQSGLTLKEISVRTGISLGTVNKIFSGGIKSVKTATWEKLVECLGSDIKAMPEQDGQSAPRKNNYGFVKCAAYSGELAVCDVAHNVKNIIGCIEDARKKNVTLAVFSELCITSYTAGDLIYQPALLKGALDGLSLIIKASAAAETLIFVGLPLYRNGRIYNCAAAVAKGELLAVIAKKNIPNYNEFYEKRYFSPAPETVEYIDVCGFTVPFGYKIILANKLMPEMRVACEICEDIWVPDSPAVSHSLAGATLIVNLSASNEVAGKAEYRRQMVSMQSSKCLCGYIYTSSGFGESTTDVVFGGHNVISEAGRIVGESKPFADGVAYGDVDCSFLEFERSKKFNREEKNLGYVTVPFSVANDNFELERRFSPTPFVSDDCSLMHERCESVLEIQSHALLKRIKFINPKKIVIGISGGLDSTLALFVCVRAMRLAGRKPSDILAVTMPSFGTSDRTHDNAALLCKELGVDFKEINIEKSVLAHFEDIGQSASVADVTFENAQARERTQVLMDLACKEGGFVVGTGDLSEIALGWCTFNGDHISMYNVNAAVPKTLVREMVLCEGERLGFEVARIARDIADTPISPELTPAKDGKIAQITENVIGPYVLHDFYLYYLIKHGFAPSKVYYIAKRTFAGVYTKENIAKYLKIFIKRFFSSQFKRSCAPDGVKTGALALSPRGDWRMPSDACAAVWQSDLDAAVRADKRK